MHEQIRECIYELHNAWTCVHMCMKGRGQAYNTKSASKHEWPNSHRSASRDEQADEMADGCGRHHDWVLLWILEVRVKELLKA